MFRLGHCLCRERDGLLSLSGRLAPLNLTSELHLSQLLPGPVGVEVCGPDEGKVDTQRSVDTATVDTNEDPVGYRSPGGILGATIKADFVTLS